MWMFFPLSLDIFLIEVKTQRDPIISSHLLFSSDIGYTNYFYLHLINVQKFQTVQLCTNKKKHEMIQDIGEFHFYYLPINVYFVRLDRIGCCEIN